MKTNHLPLAIALLVCALLSTAPQAAHAQEAQKPKNGEVMKIGAYGGLPGLVGLSVAATPAFLEFEFAASLPVFTTDFQNYSLRAGVRPTLVGNDDSASGFQLRLPLLVGPRYQYNGDDMQPRCATFPCPGEQEHQWFVSMYGGLEGSWAVGSGMRVFVEAGGGYSVLTNRMVDVGDWDNLGEARLMSGIVF